MVNNSKQHAKSSHGIRNRALIIIGAITANCGVSMENRTPRPGGDSSDAV
jgi:hypothetical protein